VSAFGLLVSDSRGELVQTFVRGEHQFDVEELEAAWQELENQGRAVLRNEGVLPEKIDLRRVIDARYLGEAHEVKVPAPAGPLDAAGLTVLVERFHDVHELTYGYGYRGEQPVELVNLRVQAVGEVHRPRLTTSGNGGAGPAVPVSMRPVYFEGRGFFDCPIHTRGDLRAGQTIDGPAIVEEFGSTTVVFPEWGARVDGYGNLLMERSR
jgi:N-methylhydantoinase A